MSDIHYDPIRISCEQAIEMSFKNKAVIVQVKRAGCYYCQEIFPVVEIKKWDDEGLTPRCPACGVDAVLPLPDKAEQDSCKGMLSYLSRLFDVPPEVARTSTVTLTEDCEGNLILPLDESVCETLGVVTGDYVLFKVIEKGRLEITAFTKPLAEASDEERAYIAQVCPLDEATNAHQEP